MAAQHATSTSFGSPPAPWLPIPTRAISAVEHPCLVKNVDKGIASLGGPVKLSQALQSKLEPRLNSEGEKELPPVISASLRPDDPFSKRLLATPVTTNNLLLKVTVPRRTGRKRKRGSSDPFLADDDEPQRQPHQNSHVPASSVLRRLQDNVDKYTVSVAGVIDETHRFRTLPDLQFAASTDQTMRDIRDNIMPANYGKLLNYKLDTTAAADTTRPMGPSPLFIQMQIAYDYKYRQNTYLKDDEKGEISIQRITAHNNISIIKPTADSVPTGPSPNLPAESRLSPTVQYLISCIRREQAKRPIITRHILYNTLGWDNRDNLRQACVYCGYFFESGPWREALVTWGLDPRKDPKYRVFQTVSYLSYLKTGMPRHFGAFDRHVRTMANAEKGALRNEHTFDGTNVSRTGNLFQFCDISDPLLRRVLDTEDIRSSCAPTAQGWFHIGTWAKATVILKDKMNSIIGGEGADDAIYQRILEWPEIWDDDDIKKRYKHEVMDKVLRKEKSREHAVMDRVRWAARNPRYAFERMEAAAAAAEAARAKGRGGVAGKGKGRSVDGGEDGGEVEREDAEEEEENVPEDMTEVPDNAKVISDEEDSDDQVDVDDGDDDDDDERDSDDDDDEEEDDNNDYADSGLDSADDIDAEGETDEEFLDQPQGSDADSDAMEGVTILAKSEGPLPFGGFYKK